MGGGKKKKAMAIKMALVRAGIKAKSDKEMCAPLANKICVRNGSISDDDGVLP